MPYYDTIDEDLARAKQILDKGKGERLLNPADRECSPVIVGGTIYGADIYAAYKLLESFVAEIGRLEREVAQARTLLGELVDVDWCIGYEMTEEMQARIDDVRTRAAIMLDGRRR